MNPLTFEQDRARLERILVRLRPALPDGHWFINGSGALVLNGIETGRPMGDLDIFLATYDWWYFPQFLSSNEPRWEAQLPDPNDSASRHDPPYWEKVIEGLPVNVFSSWRTRHVADIDCNFLTLNAEIVAGWPCAPLQMILDWKEQKLRAKDSIDVEAIYRARPDLRPRPATA